jgi:hypothetical protein
MRVLGPTRWLAGFLADAKNLLNGLVREIPQARSASSRASSFPRMTSYRFEPVDWLARFLHDGGVVSIRQPAGPTTPAEKWPGQGLACSGKGDNPSMVVVLQEDKRRGPNSEPLVRSFGNARTCAVDGCTTQLSRYNPARCCYLHQGWDLEPATRPRRRTTDTS